jgi:hypothetical protein
VIRIKISKEQAAVWQRKAKGSLKEFVIETLQDINEEVVYNTPVITGFLRGSWWSTIGGASGTGGSPDPSGAETIARLNMTLIDLDLGDVYTVSNGANYAGFVEFGTKHMAPRAMVGRAVARFQAIAQAAAVRVRARNA